MNKTCKTPIRGGVAVYVEGGLGNQIFHYAFCYVLSKHLKNRKVWLDCSAYRHTMGENARNLEITNFNITLPILKTKRELAYCLGINFYLMCVKRLVNKISYKFFGKQIYLFSRKNTIIAPHKICANLSSLVELLTYKNYIYQEYMWNFSYFIPYKEILRTHLELKIPLSADNLSIQKCILRHKNACMIHIRRGDFLRTNYDILEMDYYHNAMNILRKKYNDVHFFVFGNDYDFMIENFNELDCSVVSQNGEDSVSYDFVLMRSCKHCILANSTLSMWIGFLCNGDVIYKKGTTPKIDFCEDGYIAL